MTENINDEAKNDKSASPEIVEVSAVTEMIKGALEPFAESQKIVAAETTKQTEIIAKETTKIFAGIFLLAGAIIVLAGTAMFLDKDQITLDVIIAISSFIGGMGVSGLAKRKS